MLLHAGVADRRSWTEFAAALDGCEPVMRFLSFDRRGFGDSVWEPAEHEHTGDLIAVLDACRVDRAVLVGNSQGGRIAIDAALTHPERVSALVLIGTAVSGAPGPDTADAAVIEPITKSIEQAEAAGDLDCVNELEAQLWLDGPRGPVGRVTGKQRRLFLEMNSRALRAAEAGEVRWPADSWNRLASIACPTLVVVGERDLPHVVHRSETIAETIPGAEFIRLLDCAHLPALEDPIGVANILRPFFAGLPI